MGHQNPIPPLPVHRKARVLKIGRQPFNQMDMEIKTTIEHLIEDVRKGLRWPPIP
ncbi:M3 family oligoendopeptidase [Sesbania bispinosa]|nr:M3 family oligoendopeptidase [Sesbania bispinosa]